MGSRAKAFPPGYQAQAQAGKQAWFLGVLSGLVMIVIARSFFWPGNFKPSLHWLELYSVQCTASSLHPFEMVTPIQKPPEGLHRQGSSRSIGLIFRSDHRFTCQILTTGF
ncbi:hypothetical protein BKA60DRAFT_149811 [Fusarium oxysporum]|nr:hypothetical protein BKA60DRAFT_149811 [Fusarium oxysporum]